jgi:hypothetical protein
VECGRERESETEREQRVRLPIVCGSLAYSERA